MAVANNCAIINQKVKALAKALNRKDYNDFVVSLYIRQWQDTNGITDIDVLPKVSELSSFIDSLNKPQGLPISEEDFALLRNALGNDYSAAMGLDNATLNNGFLKVGDMDNIRLNISALLDMGLEELVPLQDTVSWLTTPMRLEIYNKFLKTGRNPEYRKQRDIARKAIVENDKNARNEENENSEYRLLVETKDHRLMQDAREKFTPKEYGDRTREMAMLFSRMLDRELDMYAEMTAEIINDIESDDDYSREDKERLLDRRRNEYDTLTDPLKRRQALRTIGGPSTIRDRIASALTELVNENDESKFLDLMVNTFGLEGNVGEIPQYKEQLSKTLESLDVILQDASAEIEFNEGIKLMLTATTDTTSEADFDPNDSEQFKETWMYQYDTRSVLDDAFHNVKKLLRTIPLRDSAGIEIKTMFGALRTYPQKTLVEVMNEKFIGVHDSPSMIAMLRNMGQTDVNGNPSEYPWANDIAERLEKDANLRTQFFRDFRKAYKEFAGISNGELVPYDYVKEGRTLINVAKESIREGRSISSMPLYDKKGNIRRDNVKAAHKAITDLVESIQKDGKQIKHMSPASVAKYLEQRKDIAKTVADLLNSFGFIVNDDTVKMSAVSETPEYGNKNNLSMILDRLQSSLNDINKNENYKRVDKLNNMLSKFSSVAKSFIDKTQQTENHTPSIRDKDGNRRQTHVLPSFLDNIMEGLNGKIFRNIDGKFRRETKQEFIDRKYGRFQFYKFITDKGRVEWRLRWLEDIYNGVFEPSYVEVLDAYNKPFAKWTEGERNQMAYDMFFDKRGPYYILPVTSDTQAARFVKAPRYTHDEIVKGLIQIIYQEKQRYDDNSQIKNENYRNNKNKWNILTELEQRGSLESFVEAMDEAMPSEAEAIVKDAAEYVLKQHYTTYVNDKFGGEEKLKDAQKESIAAFVENSMFAQIQMMEMFGGDPAFYENYEDFQKRFKEVIVPMKPLDTDNPNGTKVERCLYISDPKVISQSREETKAFLKEQKENGMITDAQYNKVIGNLDDIKYTDGQALRLLDSYIRLMHMLGTYNERTEQSVRRITTNTGVTAEDMKTYLTAIKPFFYNLVGYESQTSDDLAVPVQHKCSEQVLLPDTMIGSLTSKAPMLAALYKIMTDYKIDTILFSSAVKVGNNGHIQITDGGDIYTEISNAVEADPTLIHEIPYEEGYGIVSEVPEHGIDHEDAIGTQTQKIVPSDIPDNAKIEIAGRELDKNESIALYNKIWTEKIRKAYTRLTGRIADNEKLSAMLREASQTSHRNSLQLERAFELDEWGNFIIPLCDPANLELTSSFINAIFHKAVGKVKMNGGQFVQQTAFGVSENLRIRYKKNKNGKTVIDCIECMMPATSYDIVKAYMNDKGVVDIKRVPKELLTAIGYRIPTAGKSFIAPLKVVDFLPQLTGNTIILPADIIWLNDSDYDVDKQFVLLPSFTIKNGEPEYTKYDIDKVEGASEGALNNMLLDLMYGMLTSYDTSGQVINAGGAEITRSVADYIEKMMTSGKGNTMMGPSYIGKVINQYSRNNDGKNMIAVFAAARAAHATAQHTKNTDNPLQLGTDVKLFGKTLNSLCEMGVKGQELISTYLADLLNAAADNAKHPSLYWLNINDTTCGVATMLIRLGYTPREVGLFLNIPIIRQYASTSNKAEFEKILGSKKNRKLSFELKGGIDRAEEAIKQGYKADAYQKQALKVFLSLQEAANELRKIDSLTRNDTGAGVPRGDLASNVARLLQYQDFLTKKHKFVVGWSGMFKASSILYENMDKTEDLADKVNKAASPIAQAFTSYSFFAEYRWLEKHYPLLGNENFLTAVKLLLDGKSPTRDNIKSILRAAYEYCQNQFEFAGRDADMKTKAIENFPKSAKMLIEEHPELLDNTFVRDLQFGDDETGYPFIELQYDGSMDEDTRNTYSNEWLKLLKNPNKSIQDFAKGLFLYSFHRNGLKTTVGSFSNLAPVELKRTISNYLPDIQNLEHYDDVFDMNQFVPLYLRNNLYNAPIKPSFLANSFDENTIDTAPDTLTLGEDEWFMLDEETPRMSFGISLADGVGYYVYNLAEGNYIKTTPLGWRGKATEYNNIREPYLGESIYAKYDIDKIEKARRGMLEESQEGSEGERSYLSQEDEYWLNDPSTPEDVKQGILAAAEERRRTAENAGQKSEPKKKDTKNIDLDYRRFQKLTFSNATDINGNKIDVIYMYENNPDNPYDNTHTMFDRSFNTIGEIMIDGNMYGEDAIEVADSVTPLQADDKWLASINEAKLATNESYKDAEGNPICPVK